MPMPRRRTRRDKILNKLSGTIGLISIVAAPIIMLNPSLLGLKKRAYRNRLGVNEMSKNSEMDRLWTEMRRLDRELSIESRECGKRGEMTVHYKKLKADMEKVKDEYEKVKGGGAYNPLNPAHGEQSTRNKVLGAFLGRTGHDTHHRLDDDRGKK